MRRRIAIRRTVALAFAVVANAGGFHDVAFAARDAGARSADAGRSDRVDAGAADASAPDGLDAVRRRFATGLQHFQEGDPTHALADFEQAYAAAPNYRLLYNIGLCKQQLGDYLGAIADFERYLAEGGANVDAARKKEVDDELAAARGFLAHIAVRVNVPDADLLVDDQTIGKASAEAVAVNPGKHKVWATKAGYYPASKDISLAASEQAEVALQLAVVPVPKVSPVARILGSNAGRAALVAIPLALLAALILRLRSRGGSRRAIDPTLGLAIDVPDAPGGSDIPELIPQNATPLFYDPGTDREPKAQARPMVLDAAVKQDIGRVKPNNQDSYVYNPNEGLFVVCDGIGGNAGGNVASSIAARAIAKAFSSSRREIGALTHLPREAAELAWAVYAANRDVRQRQSADWNISEMGTTCVSMRFSKQHQRMYIAHVGDSRAYRLRGGILTQITTDHTLAELGMVGPRAGHLSRAVGSEVCPKIDVILTEPQEGDVYLLCSDGLTKMMTVQQVTTILKESPSTHKAVADLVDLANQQGGQDNITVVVARVTRA